MKATEFGEWMRGVREFAQLGVVEAAGRIGVSRNVLWSWESGRRLPEAESFEKWAEGLKVPEAMRSKGLEHLTAAVGARRVAG